MLLAATRGSPVEEESLLSTWLLGAPSARVTLGAGCSPTDLLSSPFSILRYCGSSSSQPRAIAP